MVFYCNKSSRWILMHSQSSSLKNRKRCLSLCLCRSYQGHWYYSLKKATCPLSGPFLCAKKFPDSHASSDWDYKHGHMHQNITALENQLASKQSQCISLIRISKTWRNRNAGGGPTVWGKSWTNTATVLQKKYRARILGGQLWFLGMGKPSQAFWVKA